MGVETLIFLFHGLLLWNHTNLKGGEGDQKVKSAGPQLDVPKPGAALTQRNRETASDRSAQLLFRSTLGKFLLIGFLLFCYYSALFRFVK